MMLTDIHLFENGLKYLVVVTGLLRLLVIQRYEPATSQWLQRFKLYKYAVTDLVWPALHLPDLNKTYLLSMRRAVGP